MSDDDDSVDYYLLKTRFLALALQNACVQFSGIQASSQYEINSDGNPQCWQGFQMHAGRR